MTTNRRSSQPIRGILRPFVAPAIILFVLFWIPCVVAANPSDIDVWGFLTLEYEIANKNAASKRGTFDLHHFNILSNYQITDKSRVFGEIEWEHGPLLEGSGGVGLIALERAWFEYSFSDAFAIRLGKFLTPFGRYNQIHDATPAYATTFLPQSLYGKHETFDGKECRLYSRFSAGLEITGQIPTGSWDFQYWAFVANGRGANPYEVDDNANKAVGARLLLSDLSGKMRFGGSLYRDRNNEHGLDAIESAYTLEGELEVSGFHLETEGAWFHMQSDTTTGQEVYTDKLGGYVQMAYYSAQLVTPIVRLCLFNPDKNIGDDLETIYSLGFNMEVSESAFVKTEVHMYRFENAMLDDYETFVTSLAVAF